MCVVSAIGDNYRQNFPYRWPNVTPDVMGTISRNEFEALKREVEQLKKVLEEAKKFDVATGQPHCEMDDKVAFIKKLAEFVGVDMNEVFK